MLNFAGLGKPANGLATVIQLPTALEPGSSAAKLAYLTWSGERVIVVEAPPGSGKTTLVTKVIAHLLRRSDLRIVVATFTRQAAFDIATRLVAAIQEANPRPGGPVVVYSPSKGDPRVPGAHLSAPASVSQYVQVRTTASCEMTDIPVQCDVMFFDEAWQLPYAVVENAAAGAQQIVMVGDPGQIGPVITVDTSPWEDSGHAPHRPAPEVFLGHEGTVPMQLEGSFRLGQRSVEAIAPLYDFKFVSKRPDRYLLGRDGNPLPEIRPVQIPVAGSITEVDHMERAAALASELVGSVLVTIDEDGVETRTVVQDSDVCVVASHNIQCNGIEAILADAGHGGIKVGTADRLQGGQWHAVVAVDPLVGHDGPSDFHLLPGRLCVMASRHMTHLTWVHDGTWEQRIKSIGQDTHEVKVGLKVRNSLVSTRKGSK